MISFPLFLNVFTSTLLPLLPVSMGYHVTTKQVHSGTVKRWEHFENKMLARGAEVDICGCFVRVTLMGHACACPTERLGPKAYIKPN